jgi:hypothetical protein
MDLRLLLPFITLLFIIIIFSSVNVEGFTNYSLEQSMLNTYPESQTKLLVQNTYPPIGKNQLSNNTAADIWQDYPVFQLGSYEQITNNIRYPDNPDEGTCMPASMCGALYHDKNIGNNVIHPLPPVKKSCGTRVGYFNTDYRIITSLPYKSDLANILY